MMSDLVRGGRWGWVELNRLKDFMDFMGKLGSMNLMDLVG